MDQLSNSVIDLIRERRFDEALGVCKRLFDEYPDVVDGFDRSAMVHEARGDHGLALDFYRRALAFAESPEQRDFFDEGGRGYWRDKIRDLEAQIRASS